MTLTQEERTAVVQAYNNVIAIEGKPNAGLTRAELKQQRIDISKRTILNIAIENSLPIAPKGGANHFNGRRKKGELPKPRDEYIHEKTWERHGNSRRYSGKRVVGE